MTDTVTLDLRLYPTDLTLLQDLVREKIGWLDSEYTRLRLDWTRDDAAEVNRLMRAVYVRIEGKITQLLDVPFIDNRAAVDLIWDELVTAR